MTHAVGPYRPRTLAGSGLETGWCRDDHRVHGASHPVGISRRDARRGVLGRRLGRARHHVRHRPRPAGAQATTAAPVSTTSSTTIRPTSTVASTTVVPTTGVPTTGVPVTGAAGVDDERGLRHHRVPRTGVHDDTIPHLVAVLDDVRIGRHDCYRRVVFAFRGDQLPEYAVEVRTPPFMGPPGEPIAVAGASSVWVRFGTADAHTAEGVASVQRPIRPAGYAALTEIRQIGASRPS